MSPRRAPGRRAPSSVPSTLGPLPSLDTIRARLPLIFPEGITQRNWFVRDIAARTVFTMLYVGAVDGTGGWLRPNQVIRMTDAQAARTTDAERLAWAAESLRRRRRGEAREEVGPRWFEDTSREPVRDETLRFALQPAGAAVERAGLATTSATPRWALAPDFAALFTASEVDAPAAITAWRTARLSPAALARVALAQRGVTASGAGEAVLVRFPNGEARRMAPGLSAEITKAVVENFAVRFLADPGVLWISESRTQVVARDDALARRVGLTIDRAEVLPDVILVDLGAPVPPLFVFVEVVASDGPVHDERKRELTALIAAAGYDARHAAFVTAYWDRGRQEFRRTVGAVAWDAFVWAASEPDKIIVQRDVAAHAARLTDLLPPPA